MLKLDLSVLTSQPRSMWVSWGILMSQVGFSWMDNEFKNNTSSCLCVHSGPLPLCTIRRYKTESVELSICFLYALTAKWQCRSGLLVYLCSALNPTQFTLCSIFRRLRSVIQKGSLGYCSGTGGQGSVVWANLYVDGVLKPRRRSCKVSEWA